MLTPDEVRILRSGSTRRRSLLCARASRTVTQPSRRSTGWPRTRESTQVVDLKYKNRLGVPTDRTFLVDFFLWVNFNACSGKWAKPQQSAKKLKMTWQNFSVQETHSTAASQVVLVSSQRRAIWRSTREHTPMSGHLPAQSLPVAKLLWPAIIWRITWKATSDAWPGWTGLHFKTSNPLIKLLKHLFNKQKTGWQQTAPKCTRRRRASRWTRRWRSRRCWRWSASLSALTCLRTLLRRRLLESPSAWGRWEQMI